METGLKPEVRSSAAGDCLASQVHTEVSKSASPSVVLFWTFENRMTHILFMLFLACGYWYKFVSGFLLSVEFSGKYKPEKGKQGRWKGRPAPHHPPSG
jgi:hypothetical protein